MTVSKLTGLKVAILVTDGFEQSERVEPRKALDQAGAETRIVSPKNGQVRGWQSAEWGDRFPLDLDSKLITSRKPDDIPAFNREMIELFDRGRAK